MPDEIFIERRFELPDAEVVARLHRPVLAPGGEYQCSWVVVWPDRERRTRSCGIDGVQALMLALRSIHTELVFSDEYKAGMLTYLNQKDFDLPPAWR